MADTAQRSATVLVADEFGLFRAALRAALDSQPDLCTVDEAGDGEAAWHRVQALEPDVAIFGQPLPIVDGLSVCARIKGADLATRVLLVSDDADHAMLLAALEAGADGYISKQASLAELIDATRVVAGGDAAVPSSMLGSLLRTLIDRRRQSDQAAARVRRLSKRENEVLALVADGLGAAEIAEKLCISPQTARTHIQNLLSKLEVHSQLEAAALVHEHGLLDLLDAGR